MNLVLHTGQTLYQITHILDPPAEILRDMARTEERKWGSTGVQNGQKSKAKKS